MYPSENAVQLGEVDACASRCFSCCCIFLERGCSLFEVHLRIAYQELMVVCTPRLPHWIH